MLDPSKVGAKVGPGRTRPNPTRRLSDPRPSEVGPNEVGPSEPRVNGPQPGATWRPDGGVFLGGHRRLLGVFAHPDDETFCAGGTFAGYAARGAEVMVISATRGQAGQIRDAAVGTRRTIGAVRERELRLACGRLGITQVRCLDYLDGGLADADFGALVDEVADIIREFRPDGVITFGPDGGYGHPDHIAISAVATAACQRVARPAPPPDRATASPPHRAPALYYGWFPPGDVLLMERLATWLVSQPNRFAGTPAFAHALLLLAEEAGTLRAIRDHVEVRWYPPGYFVVEQGEPAYELFLVLSGAAEVWKESDGGRRDLVGRLGVGEFFGELGIAGHRRRSADVVAAESLTCLVLSATRPSKFSGRGSEARLAGYPSSATVEVSPSTKPAPGDRAVVACDVSAQLKRKIEAVAAYRSQLPLEPDMFPEFLFQEIFGREYFEVVATARRE